MVPVPVLLQGVNLLKQPGMANQTQTLLQYLLVALPAIPTQGTTPGPNTTNPQYDADDSYNRSRPMAGVQLFQCHSTLWASTKFETNTA